MMTSKQASTPPSGKISCCGCDPRIDALLRHGDKVRLYRLFETDSSAQAHAFRAMILADHYRSPLEAEAALQENTNKRTPTLFYIIANYVQQ